jgi:hypothetical protein
LSFYLRIVTQEDFGEAYDDGAVELFQNNSTYENLAWYSNLDANSAWEYVEIAIDATPYQGELYALRFAAVTDGSVSTRFAFDSVSLIAKNCED